MDVQQIPDWVPLAGERCERTFPVTVRRTQTSGSEVANRTSVIINTADPDRHGTRILPEGCRLDNYRANPVVLINHDHNLLAATSTAKMQDGNLIAHLEDADWDLDDPEIARWHRKVAKGILRTASVGALIHNVYTELIDPEGDADDWDNKRHVIDDWELVEWSFVTVPSNPNALVTQRMMNNRQAPVAAGTPAEAPTAKDDPAPVQEAPEAHEASADETPAAPVPVVRMATPEEISRVVEGLRPMVRTELKRLTGKG